MKTIATFVQTSRRFNLLCALFLFLPVVAPAVRGAPPLDPLPGPIYSFDRESPTVQGGYLAASDALTMCFPQPCTEIPGPNLELLSPEDDLDALSAANAGLVSGDMFALLFSVDRATVGVALPDSFLVEMDVPYNVTDQAWRGHAAGDQFMSSELYLYNRPEGEIPRAGRGAGNNTQGRNNFDEGGTSFSAQPPTHSRDNLSGGGLRVPQDNVDATAQLTYDSPSKSLVHVYFSADRASPSLYDTLPGMFTPSGAHIFYNEDPMGGTSTMMYASCFDLGLQQDDDIDGLIVFDTNESRYFDGLDTVLFSLDCESPSLDSIPGTSTAPTADIFIVRYGETPALFATAYEFGLGDPFDNIDALDFFFCADPVDCAVVHGIRAVYGDWDDDGDVDEVDFHELCMALAGPDNGLVAPDHKYFDANEDEDVDLADFASFQQAFTGGL